MEIGSTWGMLQIAIDDTIAFGPLDRAFKETECSL